MRYLKLIMRRFASIYRPEKHYMRGPRAEA